MNIADMPARVAIPFANSAGGSYIRPIPVASQVGTTDGAASFTDGFPPDTFTPVGGGGAYVNGRDVNGILKFVTQWTRWQTAGGPAVFNATFATQIGGYPKGAVLVSSAFGGLEWMNTVDGNLTDPDGSAPVGWVRTSPRAATLAEAQAGAETDTFLSPAVLAALFAPKAYTTSGSTGAGPGTLSWALTVGAFKAQWGRLRLATPANSPATVFTLAYPEPFAASANAVSVFRYDSGGGTYNQKHLLKYSDGDANGFPWKMQDDDSGDTGSKIYGFDWVAIGAAPA